MIAAAAPFFGLGFRWGLFALLSAALAALFLLPALGGWGFRAGAETFARIGVAAWVAGPEDEAAAQPSAEGRGP